MDRKGEVFRDKPEEIGLEGMLSGLEGMLSGLEGMLSGLEGMLSGLEGLLSGLEGLLSGLQGRLRGMKPGSCWFEEIFRGLQPGGAFLEPEEIGLERDEHLLEGEGFGLKPSELGLEGKAFALQGMRSEAEAGGFGVKWSPWIGPISGRMIHGLEIPAALLFLVMDRRAGVGDRKEEGLQGIEPFTHRTKLRATDGNQHSTKLRFRQVPDRFAPFCILCCYPAALLSRAS